MSAIPITNAAAAFGTLQGLRLALNMTDRKRGKHNNLQK